MKVKSADTVKDLVSARLGSQDIDQLVLDGQVVWTRALMADNFNRANSIGLGANWTNLGDAEDPYLASVVDGLCRLNIPDNIVGMNLRTSTWRWNPQVTNGDDGYIETRIANRGGNDDGLRTVVWRRAANTGTTPTVGVGMEFSPLGIYVVNRSGATILRRQSCGAFDAGDVVRMTSVGNVHTVTKNGLPAGVWPDTANAGPTGAANRSMAVTVSGIKPAFSSRRFSAALDYIECR